MSSVPQASPSQAVAGGQDALLRCLVYLTAHHGQARSAESLLAGLPYDGKPMSPDLFIEAADRIGLKSKHVKGRAISDLPQEVFPCILLLDNNQACILIAVKDNTAKLWDSGDGKEKQVSLDKLEKQYSNEAIFVRPKPFFIDRALFDRKDEKLSWFWDTITDSAPIYVKIGVASVLINVFTMISPVYVMNVYDRVIPNNAIETGWALGLGVLTIYVFDFIIRTLRGYFIDFAGKKSDIIVSRRVFDQVLNMKLASRPASSGAFANMLREFDSVRDFMTSATMTGLIDLPFSALFVMLIFFLGGASGLIVCSLMALVVVVGFLVQAPLRHHVRSAMRSSEVKHGLLVETINGLETIKAIGADGRIRAKYAQNIAENAIAGQNSRFFSALGVNVATFVTQVASVLVILLGMYMVKDGNMTMGALIACVMLSGRALSPITQVANLMSRYHQTVSAMKTLNSVMAKPVERPADKVFLHRPDLKGNITFDKVKFHYPRSERVVLEDISFNITAGEKVGIVGRIGSGKSTIARLMIQLYDADAGTILFDGTDSRQIDPADLRRNAAYISQDVILFQGTIRDNIVAARPQATDQEVLAAAKAAGVHDFVSAHPMGYDAPVGERGEGLSGGQRQCVALARAIIAKPSIYVCDEPTNDMDTQAEDAFTKHIKNEISEKTLVLITHRTSLLPLVDRLIVVDKGKVVMDGPRDKVIEALSKGRIEVPK